MSFETVCGLEIHTELLTKTKIFCSCKNEFGASPNSRTCAFCSGMPGTLPVLNKRVVEFAVRCGMALNCEITPLIKFDRKNYYYPDLPKAYQISQLYFPICKNGYITINGENGAVKKIRIKEIHMEEDAGKLIHKNGKSLINYNRAGVPLLEIVSEPDLKSGTEAMEFTNKIRQILEFCRISDCKMQEGSLRADVNVSVRKRGSSVLGTRTEMKNLASLKAIRLAVDSEAERQTDIIKNGGKILLETRRWDEDSEKSFLMRTKEHESDYKYFPEPDIPPVEISKTFVEKIKKELPELPDEKLERYKKEYGLNNYTAEFLISNYKISQLFEQTVLITQRPKQTANWIMGDVTALMKETGKKSISPDELGLIINYTCERKISRESAKNVLENVMLNGVSAKEYINKNRLEIIDDGILVLNAVKIAIDKNEKAVLEYKGGKEKAFNFLLGFVMKELKGRANPETVRKILLEEIKK